MCGIFGEFRSDAVLHPRYRYDQALDCLAPRGPDHKLLVYKNFKGNDGCGVTLGHTRLSIIDLNPRANQPLLCQEGRYYIVFNGTIYNYKQLRQQLTQLGSRFGTTSDTEVIINGYKEWGADIVSRLDGIFAFAIYDLHHHSLFIARDKFGVKPCYYQVGKGFFRFASTLKALTIFKDSDLSICQPALHYQFTFHGSVPAPYTLFEGIKKIPPAHYLTLSARKKPVIKRYWNLQSNSLESTSSMEQEHQDYIEQELISAIERQINANDVEVGVLLSGGLDSSLITAILAKKLGTVPKTYSIGFSSQPEEEGNEFMYSDIVASHCGSRHTKYIQSDENLLNSLPDVISAMSEPVFAQDAVGFYILAREVSMEHRVVLSGQGADEVFAGYSWYQQLYSNPTLMQYYDSYLDRSHKNLTDIIHLPQNCRNFSKEYIEPRLSASAADSFIHQVLALDVTSFLVDDPLKRVDNMTMHHGLEARVPFLDCSLVEAAFSIPAKSKLAHEGKGILKKIAEKYLPHDVIYRKKGYFPVPSLKYIRGEMYDLIHGTLTDSTSKNRGLFNQKSIAQMLKNPNSEGRTPIGGNTLWHMALVELWLRRYA